MTINERIKVFRKEKGLNQKQLASILGVTQSGVSYMEQDGSTVSESSIKTICSVFNLNEDWLRYGSEPMYIQPPTFSLDDFVKERGADELELAVVKAYFELEPDMRHKLVEHFKQKFSKLVQEDNAAPHGVDCEIPDTPEELERQFPPVVSEEEKSGAG